MENNPKDTLIVSGDFNLHYNPIPILINLNSENHKTYRYKKNNKITEFTNDWVLSNHDVLKDLDIQFFENSDHARIIAKL